MKRSFVILILFVAFATSTCKKENYPSDIPKWLKEKIDKMEKEAKEIIIVGKFNSTYSSGCKYEECRTVQEYSDGSSTYYWLSNGFVNPSSYVIYNYNGVEVCRYESYISLCGNNGFNKYYIRLIWRES